MAGSELTLPGTVLAVEADGDFLLESGGTLVLVDVDELEHDLEMGDRVQVTGTVEADVEEGEAAELDAKAIVSMAASPAG